MPSLFSKIIAGEIPAYKVAENDTCLAFLDIMPLAEGHVLVVPKKEVDYIFDMEDNDLAGLMAFAKKVAHSLKDVVSCKRVGVSVIGLEVPHAHVHLLPLKSMEDIYWNKKREQASSEELADMAKRIAQAVTARYPELAIR